MPITIGAVKLFLNTYFKKKDNLNIYYNSTQSKET
jgi:hypothetical protein